MEDASKYNWRVPRIEKSVSVSIVKCHKCGFESEIFSDEEDNKCPKCTNSISKKDCETIREDKFFGY